MTRELRVEPNIVGTPADGWALREWNIEPANITLRGATKMLAIWIVSKQKSLMLSKARAVLPRTYP